MCVLTLGFVFGILMCWLVLLVVVDSGSLLIFVFVGCGCVWCLMLVVVWLGGLLRFIAFGVDMGCSGLLLCCVLLNGLWLSDLVAVVWLFVFLVMIW